MLCVTTNSRLREERADLLFDVHNTKILRETFELVLRNLVQKSGFSDTVLSNQTIFAPVHQVQFAIFNQLVFPIRRVQENRFNGHVLQNNACQFTSRMAGRFRLRRHKGTLSRILPPSESHKGTLAFFSFSANRSDSSFFSDLVCFFLLSFFF